MLLSLGRGLSPIGRSALLLTIDTSTKKVALLGDSITSQNTNSQQFHSQGYFINCNMLMKNRFDFAVANNIANSGGSASSIDASKTGLAAVSPDIVFVLMGTNDCDNQATTTLSSLTSSIDSVLSYITGTLGAKAVIMTIPPRTDDAGVSLLPDKKQLMLDANTHIKAQASDDVIVVDIHPLMDAGSNEPDPSMFDDESGKLLHPNTKGAYIMGSALRTALLPLYGDGDDLDIVTGNILENGDVSGTNGQNTNSVGTVADGWKAYCYANATCTLSKTAEDKQRVNWTITNGYSYDRLSFWQVNDVQQADGYQVGDKIAGFVDIEFHQSQNIKGLMLQVRDVGGSDYHYGFNLYDHASDHYAQMGRVIIAIPEFEVAAGNTGIEFEIRGKADSSSGKTALLDFTIHGATLTATT